MASQATIAQPLHQVTPPDPPCAGHFDPVAVDVSGFQLPAPVTPTGKAFGPTGSKSMQCKLTRRAVLAGAPAILATVSLPAIAEQDPVLSAVAEYNEARAAFDAAWRAYQRAKQDLQHAADAASASAMSFLLRFT